MVYDPVRDCEVPSPATSLPSHREPRKDYITPGSSFSNPGDEITVEANGRSQPPAFGQDLRSPTAPPPRSGSGGLKGLLNDEADPRRKSRTHRSSIPSTAEEEARSRPSFHRLLNDTPAPPVSKSKSSTSLAQSSSPSNPSPGSRNRHLDPHGFLTPAAPTSTQPRPSPGTVPLPLSYHEPPYPSYFPEQQAGPSQRRQSACQAQRPMLPPQDIPAQYYENGARGTPGVASLLLRSPSVSISPRSFHTPLPPGYGPPRPSSSSSASHPLAYQPPEIPGLSPAGSSRRLSDEQAYPPSSGPNPNGRRGSASHRSSSQVAPIYSRTYPQVRSPSPIRRTMYNPRRISHPSSLLRPIEAEEVVYLRTLAVSNNPLRRRKKRPLPPWSGPSPGADARDAPTESDSSYFPLQDGNGPGSGYHRSFSIAHVDRRGSVSSSTGRPPVTPGPSVYRPAFDERPAITPTGVPSSAENPRRRNTSGNGEANLRKRPSERDDEGRDTMRRKVSETHYVGNAEAVAYHYNARPEVGVQHRELSPIIGLKKFNNWIKSVLIGKFAWRPKGAPGAKVLDIGCGKGGDLNKWKQAQIRLYVGLDIAETSVAQARDRYYKLTRPGFEGYFFPHDCYSRPISDILPEQLQLTDLYNNVTMQFCMHYAFESASKARMMIENVSRYLRKGGVFIGTIPSADLLLERLNQLPEDDEDLRFGNSCYYIQFAERRHKGLYGHQYRFFLTDAVEDVPEYLVDWDNFVALSAEYRLRLVYKKAFNEVLQEEQSSRDYGPLLGKMGVVNDMGESAMDPDQWEAANLYMAFAFEKH